MKEIFRKKQDELKNICKRTFMERPSQSETQSEIDNILNQINAGEHRTGIPMTSSPMIGLWKMHGKLTPLISLKSWMSKYLRTRMIGLERWLEEYNMNENRY